MIPKTTTLEEFHWLKHLSWSAYSLYKKCPESYRLQYVEKKDVPFNAYNTIGGKAIQKVFELFYNNEIWRKGADTQKILEEILIREYKDLISKETIDWEAPESILTKEQLLESLFPLIATNLKLIKDNKFLGKYARSEVKVQSWVDKVLIMGIADFIIHKDNEKIILDGKLTKHRNTFLKREQLIWYVMLYYLQHQCFIDKTGWIYYTYGEVEWVPVSIEDVKELHTDLKETIKDIKLKKFEAKPNSSNCFLCKFKNICIPGIEFNKTQKVKSFEKQLQKQKDSNSPLLSDSDIIQF